MLIGIPGIPDIQETCQYIRFFENPPCNNEAGETKLKVNILSLMNKFI